MKVVSKVEQEIEGNRWFEKNIKALQNQPSLTKSQLKIAIIETITYYLIDAISFRMFGQVIDQIGERPELQTMPDIEIVINQLLSLSKFTFKPKQSNATIIETFSIVINKLLTE